MKLFATLATLAAVAEAAPPALRVDPDGMIRINGERTFVLGVYDTPRFANAWSEAKNAGFNLVHTAPAVAAVRRAGALGLYAWVTTGTAETRLRETVTLLKDEPALLAWEIEDEPTFVWKKPLELRTQPETMIAAREAIRAIDPARLVYLNHSPTNLVPTLRRYNASTDIVATDIYPVIPRGMRSQFALWEDGLQGDLHNASISQVGRYAAKMREVAGGAKPVFLVLQGFAWETIQKEPDPKMILYPTLAQTRFMALQAIAHGVNGLLYWGLHLGEPGNPAWQAVKATVEELRAIGPALALGAAPQTGLAIEYFDTGHTLDAGLEYIVKGDLVIVVNADKNPVEARLNGMPGTCGTRREKFEPFAARVYRCR